MAEAYKIPLLCNFVPETCCNCGIAFAVDSGVQARWKRDGSWFYCPNGHRQHYTETDVQRLQKQLEAAQRTSEFYRQNAASEREAREGISRRLIARKAANTRLRNRVKNGVCPCCSRTFMNLQNHMKTQHPEFQPDDKE